MRAFFPPYLREGSKDHYKGKGPVSFLGRILIVLDFVVPGFEADGEYGPKTTESVKLLQEHMGFPEHQRDGHFDPPTREAMHIRLGIDISKIPSLKVGEGVDYVGPGGKEKGRWAVNMPEE